MVQLKNDSIDACCDALVSTGYPVHYDGAVFRKATASGKVLQGQPQPWISLEGKIDGSRWADQDGQIRVCLHPTPVKTGGKLLTDPVAI